VPVSEPGQGGSDHWVGGAVSHKRASGVQQAGGVACREVFECGHCTRCGEREGKKTTGTFFFNLSVIWEFLSVNRRTYLATYVPG
jgi:hypothetical protein